MEKHTPHHPLIEILDLMNGDMANKWNGKPCTLCAKGTLHEGVKTISQRYKGHSFSSTSLGAFCDHCADGVVEYDAAEEAAWLAFRDQVDTAEAAELARIRKKLKLTQLEAAGLAGGGKNAFSRYERGHARPMAAVVNLFRLLDRHPELLKDLTTEANSGFGLLKSRRSTAP